MVMLLLLSILHLMKQVLIFYSVLGGAPEGVIAAVALKCLGGEFQGKLIPSNDEEIERCVKMGIEVNKVLIYGRFS